MPRARVSVGRDRGFSVAGVRAAAALALIRILSFLPIAVARRVAAGLGAIAWYLDTRAARTTRTNLELCITDLDADARRALGRHSLAESAKVMAEMGMLFHWPEERWLALMTIRGTEHIEWARAHGRCALIMLPHFGNWECMALVLGQLGGTGLFDPPRLAFLDAALRAARQRSGATLVPIDAAGLRRVYRVLAGGGMVALLPDQVPARNAGVYAPFFGRPALTMTLAHRLIQRLHPCVLIGTATRTRGGFRVEFSLVGDEIYDPDPVASATAMNRAIEDVVRAEPSQYQWEYKRFRRPPDGVADPYRSG